MVNENNGFNHNWFVFISICLPNSVIMCNTGKKPDVSIAVPRFLQRPGMKKTVLQFFSLFLLTILGHDGLAQNDFKAVSELSNGEIYKISISEEGLYRLDAAFLRDQAGISNLGSINPDQIKLLSNGGGIIPQNIEDPRIDDLEEVFTWRRGLDDGSFDAGDYILFYGEGANKWHYHGNLDKYTYQKNPYDDFNYYFIKISSDEATVIQNAESPDTVEYIASTYDDLQVLNDDRINILGKYQSPGGGTQWFGDEFSNQRTKSYSEIFDFEGLSTGDSSSFRVGVAARSGSTSSFQFTVGPNTYNQSIPSVQVTKFDVDYARFRVLEGHFTNAPGSQLVRIDYPAGNNPSSVAWLDFIEFTLRKNLEYRGGPLWISDARTRNYEKVRFRIENGNADLLIWDISDPLQPANYVNQGSGSQVIFDVQNNQANKRFVVFDPDAVFTKPSFVGQVANQNLHGLPAPEMVILYHPDFRSAAEKLAAHRNTHSGLDAITIEITAVYDEFGGGSADPTAIRELARMFHKRSADFKYLLLLGDATYDYRNRNTAISYDNYIVAYETRTSLHPVFSYPTDDYYGLLSDDDGDIDSGTLDISVGRIPVQTSAEADQVINKIIRYDTAPQTLGDWRNRIMFMADDGDYDLHLRQIEGIAKTNLQEHPVFNQEKVYLDAYQQVSTPGGERYPEVNTTIQNNIFKGVLVYNYLGHGGQEGLADERVLRGQDIEAWNNPFRMPLFITATCSFTGYDEPLYNSAGERAIKNPDGGAIALMTTTRDVYSGQNELLTRAVFDNLFKKVEGHYLTIGEIMRISKNSISTNATRIQNARKFSIIGDPAMKLAIPEYQVIATEMNGKPYIGEVVDTIRALEKVTVKGYIGGANGQIISNFNGELQSTVFDKVQVAKTRGNDEESSEREFDIQNRVIFKGNATIENGEFEFSFVVPQDIRFEYGEGKISFYASDRVNRDAHGYFSEFIIGGASQPEISDNEGPEIQIFMDDESFEFGGTTGKDPVLIVKLFDETGINVSGSSIGHDLEAVLDGDTRNSYILNDFYEASMDDFTSGEARFPLFDLEEGRHTIEITAWDIANHFSKEYTEFVVAPNAEIALKNVLCYPNPVSDFARFRFSHNRPGSQLDVRIRIFTSSGQLVHTIQETVFSDGSQVDGIFWDGNSLGGELSEGIYFYHVELEYRTPGEIQKGRSEFEKMVIIK